MTAHGLRRLSDPVRFPKWGTDEWHEFLILSDAVRARHDDPTHPFERAIQLRERIAESVPDTTTTFNLSEYIRGPNTGAYSEELLALCGTWRIPHELVAANSTTRVVNPNNPHAYLYSDAVAICECGHPVRRAKESNATIDHLPGREGHAESCTIAQREAARERHAAKRRRIFIQMAQLGCSPATIARRLGYPEGYGDLWSAVRAVGISDPVEHYHEGRRRMIRTLLVLLRVYTPAEVAPLYGMTRKGVLQMLRAESNVGIQKLYSVRRRAHSENFEYPLDFVWKPTHHNALKSGLPRSHATQMARTDGGEE